MNEPQFNHPLQFSTIKYWKGGLCEPICFITMERVYGPCKALYTYFQVAFQKNCTNGHQYYFLMGLLPELISLIKENV